MAEKLNKLLRSLVGGLSGLIMAVAFLTITLTGHIPVPTFADRVRKDPAAVKKPLWTDCQGYVGLTYDDGPHPNSTPKMLRQLDQYGMKATFFIIGENADANPQLVRDIVARGHMVEDHTYHHPDLTTLQAAGVQQELVRTRDSIQRITGHEPEYYRPPYGATTGATRKIAAQQGLREVGWTLDTNDWRKQNWSVPVLKRTFSQVKSGDIVLMHDAGYQATVDLVPDVAATLRSKHLCPGRLAPTTHAVEAWPGWNFHVRPEAW